MGTLCAGAEYPFCIQTFNDMAKIILTALLTSLFWAFVLIGYEDMYLSKKVETLEDVVEDVSEQKSTPVQQHGSQPKQQPKQQHGSQPKQQLAQQFTSQPKQQPKPQQSTKPSQKPVAKSSSKPKKTSTPELFGKWLPLEGAKHPIEISRYGTVIEWWAGEHCSRYDMTISGKNISIGYNKNGRFEISKEGNLTFLEIFNNEEFSGKYVKEASHVSGIGDKLQVSQYATAILGYWQPYEAAQYPIEITKYGTLIEHWAKGHSSRYEYKLEGARLDVEYERDMRVEITQNEQYIYLELYNSDKFSGCYRRKR